MATNKTTYTEELKLEKPDRDDFYDIEVFNRNADIIDKFLSDIRNNSVAVFIRNTEPPESNCFWIKPLEKKTIENAVSTDEELTNGSTGFNTER